MSPLLRVFTGALALFLMMAVSVTTWVCSRLMESEPVHFVEVLWIAGAWFALGAGLVAANWAFLDEQNFERQRIQEAYRQQHLDDLAAKYTEEEAA